MCCTDYWPSAMYETIDHNQLHTANCTPIFNPSCYLAECSNHYQRPFSPSPSPRNQWLFIQYQLDNATHLAARYRANVLSLSLSLSLSLTDCETFRTLPLTSKSTTRTPDEGDVGAVRESVYFLNHYVSRIRTLGKFVAD